MPFVYGYVRVSHRDSAASGLSPETAIDKMRRWFDYQTSIDALPGYTWATDGWMGGPDLDANGRVKKDGQGNYLRLDADRTDGIYMDLAKSAFKSKFLQRDAGIRLNAKLSEGDIVLFSRLDRSFRNTGDLCNMWEQWQRRGITCVFLDNNYDTRTAAGRAFMQMAAVFAEFESALKSERMLEIKALQKKKGAKIGPGDPLGFRPLGGGSKDWVPDLEQRAVMQAIVNIRHSSPQPPAWRAVSDMIERELAAKTGRPYRAWPFFGNGKPRFWTPDKCQAGYKIGLAEGWAQLPQGATPISPKKRRRRSRPTG